jgi:vacuolar-type H+-ATPase subunit E/Vma4
MDAQAILTKIKQDAQDAALRIQAEAEEKAKALMLEAKAHREALEKTMLAQAEQECARMEERLRRMADLDDRKAMLQQKRDVIDDAFRLAKDKLNKAKPADRRAFYLRQAVKCAGGDERLIVGADGADWFDGAFLDDVNKALQSAGKPNKLNLADERRKGCAGVVLSHRGAEVLITFDSLLDEARPDLEQVAAQTLFTD